MLVHARLLVLGGAVAACGSQQDAPSTATAAIAPVSPGSADPWGQSSGGGGHAYSFKVADPRGIVPLSDPDLPEAVGYSALSCVITIDFSAPAASNGLDFQTEVMRSFFKESARAITNCYASSHRDASANPVKVTLVVTSSGQITSANASAGDSKLAACVAAVTKNASLPIPRGEGAVQVTYEIRFEEPGPNDCPT